MMVADSQANPVVFLHYYGFSDSMILSKLFHILSIAQVLKFISMPDLSTRINALIAYLFLGPILLLAKSGTPLAEPYVR